jgi:hypothetical protein
MAGTDPTTGTVPEGSGTATDIEGCVLPAPENGRRYRQNLPDRVVQSKESKKKT